MQRILRLTQEPVPTKAPRMGKLMGFDVTLERQAEDRAHRNGETYVGIDVRYTRCCFINLCSFAGQCCASKQRRTAGARPERQRGCERQVPVAGEPGRAGIRRSPVVAGPSEPF